MISIWCTNRVVNQKGGMLGFWKGYNSLNAPFNGPLRWKMDKPFLHWPLLNWYTKSYGFCKFSKLPTLKLWLKFPETKQSSLPICFPNDFDSCFLVRMSCNPRIANFSCYDKLVNPFEDVFRENGCGIDRYLQSATKLFVYSPQMGQLRRTNQSSPHPSLSSPFKFGVFVVFYM